MEQSPQNEKRKISVNNCMKFQKKKWNKKIPKTDFEEHKVRYAFTCLTNLIAIRAVVSSQNDEETDMQTYVFIIIDIYLIPALRYKI